jgi:hypothetical protein
MNTGGAFFVVLHCTPEAHLRMAPEGAIAVLRRRRRDAALFYLTGRQLAALFTATTYALQSLSTATPMNSATYELQNL